MNRTRNLIILAVALVVIIAIAILASRRGGGNVLAVKMQRIVPATFTVKLPENGVVMRPLAATIPTLVAGNIGQIYVKAGDRVSAGQVLATIDNPSLAYTAEGSQADYTSASANVTAAAVQEENARVGYQAAVDDQQVGARRSATGLRRRPHALSNKAIPRNQLDPRPIQAQAGASRLRSGRRAERSSAPSPASTATACNTHKQPTEIADLNAQNQQQLALTHIVAPFDGTIQTVADASRTMRCAALQSGDAVTEGQALFTIAGGGGYIVKAEVDEQDVINVRVGQQRQRQRPGFPWARSSAGHVARIAPVAAKSTDPTSTAKQVSRRSRSIRHPVSSRTG